MKKKTRQKMKWSYRAIDEIPESLIGVYAFWYRDTEKCIYVGQASKQSIKHRLRVHWRGSHNEKLRLWIQAFREKIDICYASVELGKITRMERRLIKMWRPKANIQHNFK